MSGSRWKMYFALFAALALAYVAWVTWAVASSPSVSTSTSAVPTAVRTRLRPERFTDRPSKSQNDTTDEVLPEGSTSNTFERTANNAAEKADPGNESMYARRLHVLRVFDAVFKRKANGEELEKYSAIGTDADRMRAIVADYDELRSDEAPNSKLAREVLPKARTGADEHAPPLPLGSTVTNAADVATVGGDAALLLSDEHVAGAGAPHGAAPLSATTMAAGRKAAPVAELALGDRVSLNRADLVQRLQRASLELSHLHQLVHLM